MCVCVFGFVCVCTSMKYCYIIIVVSIVVIFAILRAKLLTYSNAPRYTHTQVSPTNWWIKQLTPMQISTIYSILTIYHISSTPRFHFDVTALADIQGHLNGREPHLAAPEWIEIGE